MYKITLHCQICEQKFEVELHEDSTPEDAMCDHTCSQCGYLVCPKCYNRHAELCHDFYNEYDEDDLRQDEADADYYYNEED